MSQMAPEKPPAPKQGGNVFTRKIGPLPMWAWLAIGLGVIGVYYVWQSKQNSSASDTTSSDTGDDTNASQVPQFVNQTYTSVTPPAAPTSSSSSTSTATATSPAGAAGASSAKQPWYRHVATGTETLAQIAKARGTTVAHIIAVSKSSSGHGGENAANLKKFLAAAAKPNTKLPKGTIYYTTNP